MIPRPWQIFDAMQYAGKPDLGLAKAVVTGPRGWAANAKRAQAENAICVLDFEHLPLDARKTPVAQVAASVESLQLHLWAIRLRQPGLIVGVYGVPLRDWVSPIFGDVAQLRAWYGANNHLAPLAREIGIVTPSIYIMHDDLNGAERYLTANLDEARRLFPQKLLYPVFWLHYHDSDEAVGDKPLRLDLLRAALPIIRERSDGLILWSKPRVKWTPEIAERVEILRYAK